MTLIIAFLTPKYAILASDRLVLDPDGRRFENATKQILVDGNMSIAYAGVADLGGSWEKPGYDPEQDVFHRPDHFLFREMPGPSRGHYQRFLDLAEVVQKRWMYSDPLPLAYAAIAWVMMPEGPQDLDHHAPVISTVSNYLVDGLRIGGVSPLFRAHHAFLHPRQACAAWTFGIDVDTQEIQGRLAAVRDDPNAVRSEMCRIFADASEASGGRCNTRVLLSYIPKQVGRSVPIGYSESFGPHQSFVLINDGVPSRSVDAFLIRAGGINFNVQGLHLN